VTATDPSGNSASCRTSVTVRDTVAPALSLTADPSVLWPPNHRLVPVQVSWRVRDACDPAPVVVLVAVSGNEPDDAVGDNDGRTETDVASAEAGTADGQILLRAERLGSGSGRQYELTYRAIDAHDNSASALVVVTVPHDLGSGPEPLILRFEGEATRTGTRLYWNTVPGATAYDVVMGDLSSRSFEGSRTVLRATRILAHETDLTSVAEPTDAPGPAPGRAFFYLIQYLDGRGGSGYGTESALWPLEVLPVEAESASGGSDSEYLRR
jgi:hypothetical protein